MSKAKKMIESEISLLSPPAGNCCCICSSSLSCPAAFVGDAAQAFEAVSQERVLSAIHSLTELSKKLQQPDAIQVSRKHGGGVCWGGSIKTPYSDRFIFTRRTLTKFVIVTLLMRLFILGPLIVIQKVGIPIGGPWSPTLLSLALSQVEHAMRRFKWRVIRERFPNLPPKFEKAVMVKRYVDDVLATSRCMCDDCLRVIQRIIYDGVLVFDEDPDATQTCGKTRAVKMLDLFFVWGRYLYRILSACQKLVHAHL